MGFSKVSVKTGQNPNGQPNNFVVFRPKKAAMRIEPRLARTDDLEALIEGSGLDVMGYDTRWGRYRLRLIKGDVKKHASIIRDLCKMAYEQNGGGRG